MKDIFASWYVFKESFKTYQTLWEWNIIAEKYYKLCDISPKSIIQSMGGKIDEDRGENMKRSTFSFLGALRKQPRRRRLNWRMRMKKRLPPSVMHCSLEMFWHPRIFFRSVRSPHWGPLGMPLLVRPSVRPQEKFTQPLPVLLSHATSNACLP